MIEVRVNCPSKGCKYLVVAELNDELVPEDERDKLKEQAEAHLLKSVKQHHKDGHPKS